MVKKPSKKRAGKKKGAKPRINLSDCEKVYIVTSLIESNEFRKLMRDDPVKALAELGIKVTRAQLPDKVKVPRKDVLRRHLSKFINRSKGEVLAHRIGWFCDTE